MSKVLTLTLNATDIKTAVKSDTYITGQVDKASDMVKNAAKAFAEQAGDENYHEVKLFRTMKGALAKMEAAIAEYVETSDPSAQITDTLTRASTTFTVSITVNDRASSAFATTLAYLAQEYIINAMLYYWWQPIDANLAKDYIDFANANILDIRRCLSKSAPSSTTSSYTDISGSVTPIAPDGSTTPAKPEFDCVTTGLYYLRGKVNVNGSQIVNPIVRVDMDNSQVFVCDTENTTGTHWLYDETAGKPVKASLTASVVNGPILAAARLALAAYGISVTEADGTDSYKELTDVNGYIKMS